MLTTRLLYGFPTSGGGRERSGMQDGEYRFPRRPLSGNPVNRGNLVALPLLDIVVICGHCRSSMLERGVADESRPQGSSGGQLRTIVATPPSRRGSALLLTLLLACVLGLAGAGTALAQEDVR